MNNLPFTDEEYILIYENAILVIEDNMCNWACGLCFAIFDSFNRLFPNRSNSPSCYAEMEEAFPHIYKHRPVTARSFWFPTTYSGHLIRIEILKEEINNLKEKTNEKV